MEGQIDGARKMLILNFNFDEKKFPEIERQFKFSNSLERLFQKDLTITEKPLNDIITTWISIREPIWFFNVREKEYSKVAVSVDPGCE